MILKNILIIIIAIALIPSTYAQQKVAESSFQKVKAVNNSGYILGVNQESIKWKDTACYYASKLRGCRYARILVTLTNITADTLKYIDMSCSTLDIFTTDTKDARIIQNLQGCFKNNPTMFKLAPYASVTFQLPVCFSSAGAGARQILITKEFKVGMCIFKYNEKTSMSEVYPRSLANNSENIIWSKAVIVQ